MLSANARRQEIYHLAVAIGLASVEGLSARFEVAAFTIRRDLALLNGQGRAGPHLRRRHGPGRAPGGVAAAAHRRGIRAETLSPAGRRP